MRRIRDIQWTVVLLLLLCAALVVVACGDDGGRATAPSIVRGDGSAPELAAVRAHGSDGDDDGDDVSDDLSDDDSDDDDDDSADDDSADDDSDDDSNGGSSGDQGEDARLRGLFFGFEGCPSDVPGCVLALRIKDTLVIVTAETRVDNEPAGIEGLPATELSGLLAGSVGLPMRVRGVGSSSGLIASEVRIDDEIRATGTVVTPAAGCDVTLLVRASAALCFVLPPSLSAPPVGSEVRIEGIVLDSVSPYRATEIEDVE